MKSRSPVSFDSDCLVCPLSGADLPWPFGGSALSFLAGAVELGCLELSRCSDMVRHGRRARVLKRMECVCVCVQETYLFVSRDPRGLCIKAHTGGLRSIRLGLLIDRELVLHNRPLANCELRTSNYSFSAMPSNLQTEHAETLPNTHSHRLLVLVCAVPRPV